MAEQGRVLRFLKLVSSSWGRRASRRRTGHEAPRLDAEATAAAAQVHEKRRRRAASPPGSVAASQWRPTLGAISEHRMLRQKAAGQDKGRKQGSAAPAARARGRHCNNDDRDYAAAAVFPASSPTAFLF